MPVGCNHSDGAFAAMAITDRSPAVQHGTAHCTHNVVCGLQGSSSHRRHLAVLLLAAVLCSLCLPTLQDEAKPSKPAAPAPAAPAPVAQAPPKSIKKSKVVEIAPEADVQNEVDDIDVKGASRSWR